MSLYDKASLTMTPSGVKNAKIYSNKPYGGNGDFTFARSSIATRVNSDGYIENVVVDEPRLNYSIVNGVVQDNPSLLLEPARTNLITYSEDFSNAYWNKSDTSVVSGFVSPSGTLNAFKLVENTSNSNHWMYSGVFNVTATNNNFSFFVKPNGRTKVAIRESNNTGKYASFNLTTKSVIDQNGTDAKIEEMSNGWLRISFNNLTTTVTAVGFFLLSDEYVSGQPYGQFYTGDGASGVYIWGAQAEAASYPTSYIPTSGSIVPRAAETATGAGTSADFNSSEGVLYAEVKSNNDSVNRFISVSDGDASDRVSIVILTNDNIYGQVRAGNSEVFFRETSGIDTETYNKIAVSYKSDETKLFVNGIQVGSTDTSVTMPSGLDTLEFFDGAGNNGFYGNTKEVAYFKEALTDTELESLTSWTSFNAMATGQLYTIK